MDFDDPMFERRPYDPWAAYGQSKTANILFAVEAAAQRSGEAIAVNAAHPGRITTTELMRPMTTAAPAPVPASP